MKIFCTNNSVISEKACKVRLKIHILVVLVIFQNACSLYFFVLILVISNSLAARFL